MVLSPATHARAARWSLAFLLLFCASASSQTDRVEGDPLSALTAAFIYKCALYVKWPNLDESDTFVIHVLGESSLTGALQRVAELKKIGGKKLVVVARDAVQDSLETCHILYVSPSMEDQLEAIHEANRGKHVLTIGDTEGFAKKGVAINFVLVEGKLKFEINQEALALADLRASSQFLKLGILVD